MNLTDLRDELTTHADDLGTATDLRAGVAAKVTQTKRRRAVAGGAGASLAVAALAVAVVTGLGRPAPTVPAGTPSTAAPMLAADGMPFRTVPDAPGDIVKNGLRYRSHVADDTLAAGFIGDRGQGQFTLVWEPTTTKVSFGAECYLPGLTQAEARKYMVAVGLEGTKSFFGSQCSGNRPTVRDLPAGGGIPGEPGQGWPGLTPGQTVRVRVQLVDAKTSKPASVEGAQLTGAVYELGAQSPVEDASGKPVASLPEVLEHEGYRYRLLSMATAPAGATGRPRLETPAGVPFLVTGGSTGSDPSSNPGTTYITGLDEQSGVAGGGWQTLPQPARAAGTVSLRTEGTVSSGTAFVTVYTLER